ncbi:hypothetical protein ElyMa_001299000 [Elysia marginata]|uniref:Uncharacterized protein n=1 Tax=Elysia marginata TaxID=1093978 RepID=A0AAV4IKT0_9GAST|nr:hypothetical protein ElyMa_001299000 [Elysia marginata]
MGPVYLGYVENRRKGRSIGELRANTRPGRPRVGGTLFTKRLRKSLQGLRRPSVSGLKCPARRLHSGASSRRRFSASTPLYKSCQDEWIAQSLSSERS